MIVFFFCIHSRFSHSCHLFARKSQNKFSCFSRERRSKLKNVLNFKLKRFFNCIFYLTFVNRKEGNSAWPQRSISFGSIDSDYGSIGCWQIDIAEYSCRFRVSQLKRVSRRRIIHLFINFVCLVSSSVKQV